LLYPCFESKTDSTSNRVRRLLITRLLNPTCVTSGFRRVVGEICDLLGYFAAYGGNSLPTFRDKISLEDSLFRNFGKKLLLLAAI